MSSSTKKLVRALGNLIRLGGPIVVSHQIINFIYLTKKPISYTKELLSLKSPRDHLKFQKLVGP